MNQRSLPYLPALDGLRAFAILLVLWHHGPILFRLPIAIYQSTFWRMGGSGWMGVDLFFVLSGFLITTILLRTRVAPHSLRRFWLRRALRIFPLAFLYLTLLYVGSRFGEPPDLARFARWPAYFLYCANLDIAFRGWVDGSLAILWSLAIEEQFYALWPFATRWLAPRRLLALCLVIVVASPFVRKWTFAQMHYPAVYVATWCRFDTLAIGAALALLFDDTKLREHTLRICRLGWPLAALTVLLALCEPFGMMYPGHYPDWFPVVGYTVLPLAFAVFVALAADGESHPLLGHPLLRAIGRISYGLYVWHYWVGDFLRRHTASWSGDARLSLWIAATFAVATLSWFAFERPILSLKARAASTRP
jgi:peptidoglycan/LPS O-acetylase OafA/YrhL